jgi:hypothetical protein
MDNSELRLPSKLANSTFLQGLSSVSGEDFVGQEVTAETLLIARTYTIGLFTSCAQFATGTICTSPRVGYVFNPKKALNLENTSLRSAFTPAFNSTISAYWQISYFLAVAYILSFVLISFAPLASFISTRRGRSSSTAMAMSVLATLVTLAASVTATIHFKRVTDIFNEVLDEAVITTTLGKLFIVSWVAFLVSLIFAIVMVIQIRNNKRARAPSLPRGMVPGKPGVGGVVAGDAAHAGEPAPGFLQRMQTWNRHRYVQIERQPVVAHTGVHSQEGAVLLDPMDDVRHENDLRDDDDIAHSRQQGIAMMPLAKNGQKDLNTAYEPYLSTTRNI